MKIYQSKHNKFAGTSYCEIEKKARLLYKSEARKTKRRAYVRSIYFDKDKIFISLFWEHLNQKPQRMRKERLKYYQCALDLLKNTRFDPVTKPNPNGSSEMLHRFAGVTKDGDLFFVQVKEDLKSNNKFFMSVFSPN
jgi:hypothetical protein